MVIVKFIRSPERTPAPAALIRTRVADMINHSCKTDQKNPDKTKVMQSTNTINKKESNEVFTAGIKDKRWPLKQGIQPDFLTFISSIVLQNRNMTERRPKNNAVELPKGLWVFFYKMAQHSFPDPVRFSKMAGKLFQFFNNLSIRPF